MITRIEEKKVLQKIESIVNNSKTHLGKTKEILKSLLFFFASREKFKTVKSLVDLIQSFDERKIVEKTVKRYTKKRKYSRKYRKKPRGPSVSVLRTFRKGEYPIGTLYCNAAFCEEHKISESKFERVMLSYFEKEDTYEIGMFFARAGEDGMTRKDYVYNLNFNKSSLRIFCSKFVIDHRLAEKCNILGNDRRGKPKNKFFVKQLENDQFFFSIPKVEGHHKMKED